MSVPSPLRTAPLQPSVVERPVSERLRIEQLEDLVRLHSAGAVERGEERRFTLLYLRGYAGLDGRLPNSFDVLVDDVFGDLLEPVRRAS